MAPLRIGLIGCGFVGRFHSRAIPGLTRRGLVDSPDIDVVYVCVPNLVDAIYRSAQSGGNEIRLT